MGQPPISAKTVLQVHQTLLYVAALTIAGLALPAFFAYLVFLCQEIFLSQFRSKAPRTIASRRTATALRPQHISQCSEAETPAWQGWNPSGGAGEWELNLLDANEFISGNVR